MKESQTSPVLPLSFIALTALLYRVFYSLGYLHKADAVVIAIMADDIATGKAFPMLHYGSQYMGAIEAWITAPLFIFTGPTWWGIAFAPIIVSAIGVIPFYLLGKSLGGKNAGLAAAILWAITPFAVTFYNITPRGPYPEVICGGALLIWFATERWKGVNFGPVSFWSIGLLMGLLLWTSLLSVPYIAVTLLFVALAESFKVFNKRCFALIAGFIVGAAPIVSMLRSSIGSVGQTGTSQFSDRLGAMIITGKDLFVPYAAMNPPTYLSYLGWALLALVLLSLVTVFVSPVVATILRADKSKLAPLSPLILFTLLFIFLYLLNDRSLQQQSRYLLPLFTSFIGATSVMFVWLWKIRGSFAILLLGIILTASFSINNFTFHSLHKNSKEEKQLIENVTDRLNQIGLKSVIWVDYERAHLLNYEAIVRKIDLKAMSIDGARIERITNLIEKDPDTGVILTAYPDELKRQLKTCCGGNYKVDKVLKWDVIHHIKPVSWPALVADPSEYVVSDDLKGMVDRKFTTTFASNKSFIIELKHPRSITKIRAIYGGRQPESTSIKVSMNGKLWTEVSPPAGASLFFPAGPKVFTRALKYEREHQEWNFKPVMAKYIKFDIRHPAAKLYDIHDLFIYSHAENSEAAAEPTVKSICDSAKNAGIKVLAVNRWIAAHLQGQCENSFDYVKPSFGYTYYPTQTSIFENGSGLAALVEKSDSDELRQRLIVKNADFNTVEMGAYTLFILKSDIGNIWWTGFTLIDY